MRKDRQAIEANMAEDFRQIDGAGNVETKASFVADLVSPDLTIDPYTVEDFDVRLYGDVALLCGRTRMTGTYQGKPFTSHYRYIDIYVDGTARGRSSASRSRACRAEAACASPSRERRGRQDDAPRGASRLGHPTMRSPRAR